ncbi:MAG: HAD-IC family P-type ATPase, partial [Patescibacteria group bacterium]
ISADGRIIDVLELEINEATLTGESEPVKKVTGVLSEEIGLADRTNMAYAGTNVVNGRGKMVVTATGSRTQIGQIARLVQETDETHTPLERELGKLSRSLGVVVILLSVILIVVGLLRSNLYTPLDIFQTAVAVAVAAIPEGLAISLTVILAVGMQFILKRRALVRKLLAAETLGSVSVICTDKTGTLTEGTMSVVRLVTTTGELNRSELAQMHTGRDPQKQDALLALRIGALCNNVTLRKSTDEHGARYAGDTTEVALAEAAHSAGFEKEILDHETARLFEVPFDSRRKFMATLHQVDHKTVVYIKGAFDILFQRTTHFEKNGEQHKLTEVDRNWFVEQEKLLTSQGLRVLALCQKILPLDKTTLEETNIIDLTLVGLIALSDPIRSDVLETIKRAHGAGIRVVMITGDGRDTASAIGRELGFSGDVLTGAEIQAMDDAALTQSIKHVNIFARVSPEDKIRLVEAY